MASSGGVRKCGARSLAPAACHTPPRHLPAPAGAETPIPRAPPHPRREPDPPKGCIRVLKGSGLPEVLSCLPSDISPSLCAIGQASPWRPGQDRDMSPVGAEVLASPMGLRDSARGPDHTLGSDVAGWPRDRERCWQFLLKHLELRLGGALWATEKGSVCSLPSVVTSLPISLYNHIHTHLQEAERMFSIQVFSEFVVEQPQVTLLSPAPALKCRQPSTPAFPNHAACRPSSHHASSSCRYRVFSWGISEVVCWSACFCIGGAGRQEG